jgi:SGNH hydrolase-like domain, acetyltransferase AlgX
MENKKARLFILLYVALALPLLQKSFGLTETKWLKGDVSNSADVDFSWNTWWDGTYQLKKNSYFNDQAGFRPDLVRINNQLDYWLFKKLHSGFVVIGKNHCLYQEDYINSYYGRDYVGYDSISNRLTKLKAIQDTLASLGKTIVLIHAPCKAFFYPEYFPDRMKGAKVAPTNYETCVRLADSLKINQVDFNARFISLKKTCPELLYPMQGIHWTVYGSLLAGDSLTRYMEGLRHVQMPHIVWSKSERTIKARDTDDDLFSILNLILPITKEQFTYPQYSFANDSTKYRPRAIYIGDSFISNWIHDGFMANVNREWEYWFYFNLIVNAVSGDNPANCAKVQDSDWMAKIRKADCVVLMYTSHNMNQLGNGFIEKAYDYYYPEKSVSQNQQ